MRGYFRNSFQGKISIRDSLTMTTGYAAILTTRYSIDFTAWL